MKDSVTYVLSRVLELLITLLLVSLLTFVAFSIIPGDTASVMLGPNATPAQVEALREKLGLNDPLYFRYLSWLKGAFTGNLGDSSSFNMPVSELIISRLPVTFGLSFLSLLLVLVISYPSAILSARRPGKFWDQVFSIAGHVSFAIPPFVLSILSILLASKLFGYFGVGKYVSPSTNFAEYVYCLLLPAFCVAVPKIAMTFKFLRASILTEKNNDYVRTSKSRGLSDIKIMFRHIIPNSNVSVITALSIVLSDLLGGSLIVEQVFNLPGLGRLLLQAISRRDFPLLSGIVFYLAAMMVIVYFLTDLMMNLFDPRLRKNKGDNL
ncbi:MAG: ABC transporter permease [Clostridiales bacterium]|nr:ABC transporter permease [Clostridiales bacterium]